MMPACDAPGEQGASGEGRGGGVAAVQVVRHAAEHELSAVRAAPKQRLHAVAITGGQHAVLRGRMGQEGKGGEGRGVRNLLQA